MPKKDTILKYNKAKKFVKVLFVIHYDIESLHEVIDKSHNNLEKSSATKTDKHTSEQEKLGARFCRAPIMHLK